MSKHRRRHSHIILNSVYALVFVAVWIVALVFVQRLDRIEAQRQIKADKTELSTNAVVNREFRELPVAPEPVKPVEVVPQPRPDDLVSPAVPDGQDTHVGIGQHRPQVKRVVPKPRQHVVPLPRSRPCPVQGYCTDFGG